VKKGQGGCEWGTEGIGKPPACAIQNVDAGIVKRRCSDGAHATIALPRASVLVEALPARFALAAGRARVSGQALAICSFHGSASSGRHRKICARQAICLPDTRLVFGRGTEVTRLPGGWAKGTRNALAFDDIGAALSCSGRMRRAAVTDSIARSSLVEAITADLAGRRGVLAAPSSIALASRVHSLCRPGHADALCCSIYASCSRRRPPRRASFARLAPALWLVRPDCARRARKSVVAKVPCRAEALQRGV